MKHLYYILISISIVIGTPQLTAQIYSTAGRTTSYRANPSNDYATTTSFRSTSSYRTSYDMPKRAFQADIQFANGQIQTAASTLSGGILADDAGYMPTHPQRNGTNEDDDQIYDDDYDYTENPPDTAPIELDWDSFLLLLALALLYAYSIYRKQHSNHTTQS